MELKMQPDLGEINVENAKKFMHIDFDVDDERLGFLLETAREYIKDTLDNYDESKFRVRFLVFALTDSLRQNPEYISKMDVETLPYHIRSMINQLNL